MDLSLKDKRALVCGSTQGIGLAIAEELAAMGAGITLMARDESKLQQVLNQLKKSTTSHHYLVADFDDPSMVEEAITRYVQENDVHILINNSGGPPGGRAIEAELEEYRVAFNRHLICNQILSKSVTPAMKKAGFGRIINIISTSVKCPLPGLGVSNTIRGAVASWSKTLANELGSYGITVNNVLPGATMTGRLESIIQNKARGMVLSEDKIKSEMLEEIPAARFADAEEVAAAAAFLASPAAGYINGINLPVDGGRLACL